MKFLANINDPQYMKEFHNIIITLSKLCKECLMDIRDGKLYFMANEEQTATTMTTATAPLVWIEIDANNYFHNYIMEGLVVGDENNGSNSSSSSYSSSNRIMLTVSPIHLSRALNALKLMARSFKMKLINLQFPCLRIEVDIVQPTATVNVNPNAAAQHRGGNRNRNGNGDGDGDELCNVIDNNHEQMDDHHTNNERQIVHDVPVSIISRSDWSYYRLPQIPITKFLIHLKSYRLMKNLIDKLKNITPTLIFEGNSAGVLCLMAKTEMATITMRYEHLEIHMASQWQRQHQQKQQQQQEEEEENVQAEDASSSLANSNLTQVMATCSVDCKKAATFLTALQVPASALDCAIDDDHLIHLQVNVRAGVVVIHSILPALCL